MKKIIPIFIPHQGCPNDCVFCNQRKITGKLASIDFDEIKKDIAEFIKTISKESDIEIAFFGGSFTAIDRNIQKKCLDIANEYMKKDYRIKDIRISTRPDSIDKEILDFLKINNVTIIELGVQSLDKEVLKLSNRGHDDRCVYTASNLIKEQGFRLGLQMMVGLPGDSPKKSIFTAMEFAKIKPDFARIYPVLVIKETALESMLLGKIYTPLSLDDTVQTVKKLYSILINSDIEVIRIGLQASDTINVGKEIVAGPFHPSIGELVYSSLIKDYLIKYIKQNKNTTDIDITCGTSMISKIVGNKKSNIKYFKENLNININIQEDILLNKDTILLDNNYITINSIAQKLYHEYF